MQLADVGQSREAASAFVDDLNMYSFVAAQLRHVGEGFLTKFTGIRALGGVDSLVLSPIGAHVEGFATRATSERPRAGVDAFVHAQARHLRESLVAHSALERPLSGMHTLMLHQRARRSKRLIARLALVRGRHRVDPLMGTQRLYAGKALTAKSTVVAIPDDGDVLVVPHRLPLDARLPRAKLRTEAVTVGEAGRYGHVTRGKFTAGLRLKLQSVIHLESCAGTSRGDSTPQIHPADDIRRVVRVTSEVGK